MNQKFSTRLVIRAFMAGAILELAAVFAITVTVQTGSPILGAVLFPVGFIMLYLMGFDLLTGVFMLSKVVVRKKANFFTLVLQFHEESTSLVLFQATSSRSIPLIIKSDYFAIKTNIFNGLADTFKSYSTYRVI